MSFQASTPLNCLYCQLPAERPIGPEPDKRRVGKCPECAAPHHVWCWHVNGGCARPNCLSNPKTRGHGTIPYLPVRVHEVFMTDEGPERPHVNTDRWTAFEKFEAEYATGSHRRMAAAWNDELFGHFQPAEKYRAEVTRAIQCVRHLDQLLTEYRQKRWQRVVEVYEAHREHFDSCSDYLNGFKPHVEEAFKQITLHFQTRFNTALEQNDDEALEAVLSERAVGHSVTDMLDYYERLQIVTVYDRERAAWALERLAVIREIRNYLARVDAQHRALALYDEKEHTLLLADSRALTKSDRSALYDARRAHTRDALREAVMLNDDEQILAAANAALAVGWTLPDATLDRVRQAAERKAARVRVAQAENERDLIIAYDEALLENDRQFSQTKREAINDMRRLYKPLLALRRAIKKNDLRAVAALISDPVLMPQLVPHLDLTDKIVVERVQEAVRALPDLRTALAVRPRTEAVLKQIVDLGGGADKLPTLELLMTPFEKKQLHNALDTFTAIDELSRLAQAPDMAYVKRAIARTYKKAQAAGISLPSTLDWNKIRAAVEFDAQWSALTAAIQSGDERAMFEAWNPFTMSEGLELLDEPDKLVLEKALQNTTRNARLATALKSEDAQRIAFAKNELANSMDEGTQLSESIAEVN